MAGADSIMHRSISSSELSLAPCFALEGESYA
jgi:hypothetical protein